LPSLFPNQYGGLLNSHPPCLRTPLTSPSSYLTGWASRNRFTGVSSDPLCFILSFLPLFLYISLPLFTLSLSVLSFYTILCVNGALWIYLSLIFSFPSNF
jgi:hypothetical protein